jgi:long-chain acyl-CoA synthetase
VKVVVVRSDGGLTEQLLIDRCRLHLTDHKVPKGVEFHAGPLPTTKLGKILRRQLREAQPLAPAP